MKQRLLFLGIFLMAASTAFAQLTTRENDATTVNLGARPQAGDAALVFNIPLGQSGDGIDGANNGAGLFDGNTLGAGDILTFKYYNTNSVAYRLGLRLQSTRTTINGESDDELTDNNISDLRFISGSRSYAIAPGIEKHFTSSNIFDVFVGADVLIGLGRDVIRYEATYDEDPTAAANEVFVAATPTTTFGVGLFTGFNVFIAQLPVSVGVEYGLSGKWIFGGQTNVEVTTNLNGDTESQEYSTTNLPTGVLPPGVGSFPGQYSSLGQRQFFMNTNHNVRLVLCFYFSSKSGS